MSWDEMDFGALFGHQTIIDSESIGVMAGWRFHTVVLDVVFWVLDVKQIDVHRAGGEVVVLRSIPKAKSCVDISTKVWRSRGLVHVLGVCWQGGRY